jgi:hypothetical protein
LHAWGRVAQQLSRRGGQSGQALAWVSVVVITVVTLGAPLVRTSPTSYRLPAIGLPAGGVVLPDLGYPLLPAVTAAQDRPQRPVPNFIPTPAPTPVPFELRPVDNSVPVFIPAGRAAPVPNALPGYSATLTLTFDDCGSAGQIQAVVDALAAVHRTGIFFVTGQCRDHFPWLVQALLAAGHQVCNHTYSHPDLRLLSDAAVRYQIANGVMTGCPYFRPPYGSWDGPRGRIARIAASYGLTPMLWDVDSRDWAGAPAGQIAAVAHARGGIILLHLHGLNTADAIRAIG